MHGESVKLFSQKDLQKINSALIFWLPISRVRTFILFEARLQEIKSLYQHVLVPGTSVE